MRFSLFRPISIEFFYVGLAFAVIGMIPILVTLVAWKRRKLSAATASFVIGSCLGALAFVTLLFVQHPATSDHLSLGGLVVAVCSILLALTILASLPLGVPALLLQRLFGKKSVRVMGCDQHLPSADEMAPHLVATGAPATSRGAKVLIVALSLVSLGAWVQMIVDRRTDLHDNRLLTASVELAMKIILPLEGKKYPPPD